MSRFIEKHQHLLDRLGRHLLAQRETVFKESPALFAQRMALFGSTCSADDVLAMESGSPSIPIGLWMSAWLAMQVADAAVDATRSDAALFLAATSFPPDIEKQMLNDLKRHSDNS